MDNPIPEYIHHFLYPVGATMLELGSKQTNGVSYKAYFEDVGIEHTSVDWNGEHGALALDLRRPIGLGQFNMVTNFGTTEHVSDQAAVWENIHAACKVGGIIVSMTPKPGNWYWHGEHHPTEEFYIQFAERNGYALEILETGREPPRENINCRMLKLRDEPFTMPDPHTIVRAYRAEGMPNRR